MRRSTTKEKKCEKKFEKIPDALKPLTITNRHITAIAGEDIFATQLDLARAYIEAGRIELAKKIILFVLEKGSAIQMQEAKILWDRL